MQLLVDHDISALPVVDSDRRVIGILSEADLLHRERIGTEKHRAWWIEAVTPPSVLALDYAKLHGRRVAELMSEDIISTREYSGETPDQAGPDPQGWQACWIVSRSNLIQALASALPKSDR